MSENTKNNLQEEAVNINEYRQVRLDKLNDLKDAGANPYEITKFDVSSKTEQLKSDFEKKEQEIRAAVGDDEEKVAAELEKLQGETVTIAGRIMSRRIMGKASFMDVRDSTDRMQVYVRRDDVGTEEYQGFKKWDIGDIVGIKGFVFKTKMG